MSRKYGLDIGGSFFPYTSVPGDAGFRGSGGAPALFWGPERQPRSLPVQIETGGVDLLPLLLTYYYRGWADHLHNWSAEASSPGTVVAPQTVSLEGSPGQIVDLTVCGGIHGSHFEGLLLSLEASEAVESFELSIQDQAGQWHHAVWGTGLGGRAGWDLTGTPRADFGSIWVPFAKEQNSPILRNLQRGHPDGYPLKAARLQVTGQSGAQFGVRALRLYDISRGQIARQLETMGRFNLLPICMSYHGGFTTWTNLLPGHVDVNLTSPSAPGGPPVVETYRGPPYGCIPSSPTYYSDLLRRAGVVCLSMPTTKSEADRPAETNRLESITLSDGATWYRVRTKHREYSSDRTPRATPIVSQGENIGGLLGNFLTQAPRFGERVLFYTHLNIFNAGAFEGEAANAQMHQVKRFPPQAERAMELLANLHYGLDGRRALHERVWVAPITVQARHWQIRQHLSEHTAFEGDTIRIASWRDPTTGQKVPDPAFPTLDLHGQTYYVSEPAKARVFLDGRELTSLKQNPPDHTGRPSVTIVDTSCANVVLDEVDLYEGTGRVVQENGAYFFRTGSAARYGTHAAEVRAVGPGTAAVHWEPFRLDSHETDFVRLSFRKTNPAARIYFSWTLADGTETVVTEGELGARQGWQVGPFADNAYHEVVLDYADIAAPAGQPKRPPRGDVARVTFGLRDAQADDAALFDGVEFLSARGVRPHGGQGLVVGGRIHPPVDGQTVTLRMPDRTLEAVTERGGWFFFHGVPSGATAEIHYERDGVRYFPVRGRVVQPRRNDLEYHIFATDPRSPFVPRPPGLVGNLVSPSSAPRSTNLPSDAPNEHAALYKPHSLRFYAGLPGKLGCYVVEDPVNNLGFIDRDRQFDNPDRAIRILLQGECWTEGAQSLTHQHMNVLLESLLSRRHGVPVEVIVTATSSSSPASYSLWFEKYGLKFNPDLVLLFLNPFNMTHLEPTLLKKLIGWDPEHSPYRMYDAGPDGRLIVHQPDTAYGAFAQKADPTPILGEVPLSSTQLVAEKTHPLVDRGFDLLRAIMRRQYKAPLNGRGKVGFIYGYDHVVPPYGTTYGSDVVVGERWLSRVESLCSEEDLVAINLRRYVPPAPEFKARMFWEYDNHLNATASYRIAAGLADEISRLPYFQELLERRKKGLGPAGEGR